MLLLVRAPHLRALALLRDVGADGVVGPTSGSGWTAAWLAEDSEVSRIRPPEPFAVLSEDVHGLSVTVSHGTDAPTVIERAVEDDVARRAIAHQLTDLVGLRERAGTADVEDLLAADVGLDELVEDLERILDLPQVGPALPDVSLVVTQCPVAIVRLAARVAGPLRLASADGWQVLTPSGPPRDLTGVAWSVADAASRHESTVHLWKRGGHHGFWVRRGRRDVAWDWGDPWTPVNESPMEPNAVADALEHVNARSFAPDDRRRLLGALSRPGEEPLVEVVRLLGLPADVEAMVIDPKGVTLPNAELVEPLGQSGLLMAMVESYRQPRPLRARTRWPYAILTGATFVMTLVSALMVMLSVAVLSTGGEYVDQPGTGLEDWAFALLSVGVTAALALTSRYRWRRLRARSRPI